MMSIDASAGTADRETVIRWIRRHAHPLTTLDPQAPLTDLTPLRDMVGHAKVVSLGVSHRGTHELSVLQHRVLRFLVEQLGFRSLALEGDEAKSIQLDEYVRTGTGDPLTLLADARSFWRTEEILSVVRWMRSYNQQHPDDPIRVACVADPLRQVTPQLGSLADIEQRLAANTIWWHEHTADKIVYWGGIAHTANGAPRTISPSSPPATHRNAGSYLRDHFGPAYVSLGLTFHHGSVPYPVPAPPPEFAEALLGNAGMDTYLLDLHAEQPHSIRAWLNAPAKTRLIGPHYNPEEDPAYHLSGGSLADWFDLLLHSREVTPAAFLA